MPPFRPLFRLTKFQHKTITYSMTFECGTNYFKSTLKMTVREIPIYENREEILTLPNLPIEYLDVTLIDGGEDQVGEIFDSYPLAISDVRAEKILDSKKLTNGQNVKEVYSIELSTSFSSFKPGDTIGIITKNREEDVERLFNHLKIAHLSRKKCKVSEKNQLPKGKLNKPAFINTITTLHHLFINYLDIQCIPKKSLIRVLLEFTNDRQEKRKLEELCSKEKPALYTENIVEGNKTFLEFLLLFPSCCPPVARLIENLPKLLPRPYSIASSPLASPSSIKVVFSVTKTPNEREGLCTGMLKEMINSGIQEEKVKIYFRKCNEFNLPETDVPLILVGPGTGIAPFMGFLEHRKMVANGGIIWLFYGCRSRTADYLFKEDLEQYLDDGVLTTLCVAFSRESDADAKYVQDNIKRYGKEVTDLIFDHNAVVYVCGDAKNMRKDIQDSFVEVFETHKGMTNKEALDHMKKLQKEKRYRQDIWV